MHWHDSLEIIQKYVVKIETQQGHGTGCILARVEDKDIGIATAAHVLEHAVKWHQPIQINNEKGEKIYLEFEKGYRCKINNKRDLALIKINKQNIAVPDELLSVIPQNQRKKAGVEIGWCGYPAIAPNTLSFFSGHVSSWIEEENAYLVDGVAINGISGGPAFHFENQKIELIGIVTAYIANRATGETLPGVSMIRDITPFYNVGQI